MTTRVYSIRRRVQVGQRLRSALVAANRNISLLLNGSLYLRLRLLKDTLKGESLSLPVKGNSAPLEVTSVRRLAWLEGEDWTWISSKSLSVQRLPGKQLCLHHSRKYPEILLELRSHLLFRISEGFDRCQPGAGAAEPWIPIQGG